MKNSGTVLIGIAAGFVLGLLLYKKRTAIITGLKKVKDDFSGASSSKNTMKATVEDAKANTTQSSGGTTPVIVNQTNFATYPEKQTSMFPESVTKDFAVKQTVSQPSLVIITKEPKRNKPVEMDDFMLWYKKKQLIETFS